MIYVLEIELTAAQRLAIERHLCSVTQSPADFVVEVVESYLAGELQPDAVACDCCSKTATHNHCAVHHEMVLADYLTEHEATDRTADQERIAVLEKELATLVKERNAQAKPTRKRVKAKP